MGRCCTFGTKRSPVFEPSTAVSPGLPTNKKNLHVTRTLSFACCVFGTKSHAFEHQKHDFQSPKEPLASRRQVTTMRIHDQGTVGVSNGLRDPQQGARYPQQVRMGME